MSARRRRGRGVRSVAGEDCWGLGGDARLGELHHTVVDGGFADELLVIARDEPIWAWASGLASKLDAYSADIAFMRPLMGYIRKAGFPHGIESLDGKEGCLPSVGCLCLQLAGSKVNFVLTTEDTGEHPLRPTMEQIANECGWTVLSARCALTHLGLANLLI